MVVGLVLAGLLLWWVLRDTDLNEVVSIIGQASIFWIVVGAVVNMGHNIFRVLRWRALLEPVRPDVPFRPMFTAVILGYVVTFAVPGRIGEMVRPMLLSEREKIPLGPCIGTIVADRVMDAVTVMTLFAVGVWLTPLEGAAAENSALIRSGALMLLAAAGLLVALMLVASAARDPVGAWLERRNRVVRWLGNSFLAVSSGMDALRSPRLLVRITIYSLLAWAMISLGTWAMVWSVGVRVPLSTILLIMPILVLGVAVPTPGGAGGYHFMMKQGLVWFAVGEAQAVGAAIVSHLSIVIPTILLGLVLIWIEKISWRDMVAAARNIKTLGDDPLRPPAERTMESTP